LALCHAAIVQYPPIFRTYQVVPAVPATQFHGQSELGQSSFRYGPGSYAYIYPTSKEMQIRYLADSKGFRVVSNLPEVAGPIATLNVPPTISETKIQPWIVHQPLIADPPHIAIPAKALPTLRVATPIAVPTANVIRHHSQDELGQASFGHSTPDQAHAAFRDKYGNQVGSYVYVNPEGKEVRVRYTAGVNGVRAHSSI